MKNLRALQLLILSFIVSQLSGQSLVKENRLWSNSKFDTEQWNNWKGSHWIKFEDDSLINDTLFKVIYRSDDEYHQTWYRYGAIREDSSNRVFIHKNDIQYMLYDFNMEVGDSILNNYAEGFYVYVVKVDTINFGLYNEARKRLIVDFRDTYHSDEKGYQWIEGVGSLSGVLLGAKNIGLVGSFDVLACFSENDTLKYHYFQNQSPILCFPQGFPDGIDKNEIREGMLDLLHLEHTIVFSLRDQILSDAEIYIYDSNGQAHLHFCLSHQDAFYLEKDRLKEGIYIFLFKSGNKYESGKFVIN